MAKTGRVLKKKIPPCFEAYIHKTNYQKEIEFYAQASEDKGV